MIIPLPPSRGPSTPSVSMRLSVTTPRGSSPSIHSDLETELPEPVEEALIVPRSANVDDIDKLMNYLGDLEKSRGADNAETQANIQELRDLLGNLVDELRQREDAPPPVPHKDVSIGSGSVTERAEPSRPPPPSPGPPAPPVHAAAPVPAPAPAPAPLARPQPPIIVQQPVPGYPIQPGALRDIQMTPVPSEPKSIYISPPRRRGGSPSTLSETESFLSSHHSDDWSLAESESYPAIPRSLSWTSSEPSSPESSLSSSDGSGRPRSVSEVGVSPRMEMPVPRPVSPTESTTSSVTARPFGLADVRDLLNGLRREVDNLRNGQDAANRMLDEVRHRPATVQQDVHMPDYNDRFARIENLLNDLLNRPQAPPVTERAARPDVPPEAESDLDSGTDTSSFLLRTVQDMLDRTRRDVPPMHMPTPARPGPSLDERLAELAASEPPPSAPSSVQQPPPLVPLIYRPTARISRPRSASPTFETDLPPRPGTVPLVEPVIFERPPPGRHRQQPRAPRRFQVPTGTSVAPPSELESDYPDQAMRNVPVDYDGVRTTTPGTTRPESLGPDMLAEVQRRRRARAGGDGTFIPTGPHVSTQTMIDDSPSLTYA